MAAGRRASAGRKAAEVANKRPVSATRRKGSTSDAGVLSKATKKAATKKTATKKAATKKAATKKAATKKTGPSVATADRQLVVGDSAPAFHLVDDAGEPVSSRELSGSPYVLYFYPKDNTPGCTVEACGFRDTVADFAKVGVRVLGVSADSSASHQRFKAKYDLKFTLIADPEMELIRAYGVWAMKKNYGREYMGIARSTFLVGTNGKVAALWRGVRVSGHVDQVLSAARSLGA